MVKLPPLSRFDEDVLSTAGVTHAVIALGTNDLGLPGASAPLNELPTLPQMLDALKELLARSTKEGLEVIVATITPFLPADGYDEARDELRERVNDWIRRCAPRVADFDAALRDVSRPSRLRRDFDSGDHLHPNAVGEQVLARAMAELFTRGE